MTIRTIFRRGFVKQNQLALDLFLQRVAHRATNICVRSSQRELSAFIVVKCGRGPALIHMAIPALGDPVLSAKLTAVRICVAGFAIRWRSLELNFVRAREYFVAFAAGDAAVSSDQWEFRFRVVEASNVDPGSSAVTRFATQGCAIGALGRHALLEFALMRIHVASRAGAVLEMERQNLIRSPAEAGFVAFRASNGHVSPS